MGKKIVFDTFDRLEITLGDAADWVAIVEVEEADTESFADILEHFNRVYRCHVL